MRGRPHLEAYQRLQAEATASGRRQHELERLKRDASVAIANADYETATACYAVVEYESAPATLLALGFTLMQTGHPAEAIVELQKAVDLGDDPNAHRYLAEAYRARAGPTTAAPRHRCTSDDRARQGRAAAEHARHPLT
jgi:predicted Zn-dependent protease